MSVTYFVAMPFLRSDEGVLVPGEAHECPSAAAAVRKAASMSALADGAVAFSRTGDPLIGEFSDAEVLASFGTVPSVDELLSAG